jgi:hypothetical protein
MGSFIYRAFKALRQEKAASGYPITVAAEEEEAAVSR